MSHPQRINLAIILKSLSGAGFIGIDTETVPALAGGKANPMKGLVTKRNSGSLVMIYQNKYVNGYEAMVQRRLIQEGKDPASFELGARKFGTRIPQTPIIEHEGNYYLEVIFNKSGESTYWYNGAEIAASDVQGLAIDARHGEQGGLDNKVVIRTFLLSSLRAIRFNKQEFVGEFYWDEAEADAATVKLVDLEPADLPPNPITTSIDSIVGKLQSIQVDPLNPHLAVEQYGILLEVVGDVTTLAKDTFTNGLSFSIANVSNDSSVSSNDNV